jgi:nitrite reductase (NADH) small subunit/3-phenylpropionate/trans-cinnamate dioxygenase ferredoxin subunit
MMGERVKVGQVDQFAPGKGRLVKVKGYEIALFNVDGSFYAISNSCPHSTGPLAEGRLFGQIVTCPWHGSQFDVTTGQCCAGPATKPVTTYPVYIEGHSIFIEIN